MSESVITKIVKEIIWLHTPAKVSKMSVCAYIDELQRMAKQIGLAFSRDELCKALKITTSAIR